VSKHDSHFLNMFSLVIGALVAIAIFLVGLARYVGEPEGPALATADSRLKQAVAERTAPIGRVAVAGHDNSALAILAAAPAAGAAPTAPAAPKTAAEAYQAVCSACHAAGIAGAPKAGDKAAWGPRIALGKPALYEHARKGYPGKAGVMPAKGGRPDLPDDLVRATVDYLVKLGP
jgi:cytochrome c5